MLLKIIQPCYVGVCFCLLISYLFLFYICCFTFIGIPIVFDCALFELRIELMKTIPCGMMTYNDECIRVYYGERRTGVLLQVLSMLPSFDDCNGIGDLLTRQARDLSIIIDK